MAAFHDPVNVNISGGGVRFLVFGCGYHDPVPINIFSDVAVSSLVLGSVN